MSDEKDIPIIDAKEEKNTVQKYLKEEKNTIQKYLQEDNRDNKISIFHSDFSMLKSDIDYIQSNNKSFSRLLDAYVNNTRKNLLAKLWFKIVFFCACVVILISIVVLMIWGTIYCLKNPVEKETLIISMINSVVSFTASFIVLPHTIANYLFNTDEEKDMTEVVKSIQEHESKIRDKIQK